MTEFASCPAMIVTAPASSQGKTAVTAALARYHRNQGRVVKVFKTGPDFLDPMILEKASGNIVHQLDLWMTGEENCRHLLYEAATTADLILVEGVMGLFDGDPSTADLAQLFEIPIAAVIDVRGTAQTFHAVAHGLANFRPGLSFIGAVANGVASSRHADLIDSVTPKNCRHLGNIPRADAMKIGERHLGLTQAAEIEDLDAKLDQAAVYIQSTKLVEMPKVIRLPKVEPIMAPAELKGLTIAVARDKAFSFIYPDNLNFLSESGATLRFFSPIDDSLLPEADAVYLPGGYPELYLDELHGNEQMKAAIRSHHKCQKPIYAECGGMLYLLDKITDSSDKSAKMLGILDGEAKMQKRLAALGYHSVDFGKGELRGHTFHYSKIGAQRNSLLLFTQQDGGQPRGSSCSERLSQRKLHSHLLSLKSGCRDSTI